MIQSQRVASVGRDHGVPLFLSLMREWEEEQSRGRFIEPADPTPGGVDSGAETPEIHGRGVRPACPTGGGREVRPTNEACLSG